MIAYVIFTKLLRSCVDFTAVWISNTPLVHIGCHGQLTFGEMFRQFFRSHQPLLYTTCASTGQKPEQAHTNGSGLLGHGSGIFLDS